MAKPPMTKLTEEAQPKRLTVSIVFALVLSLMVIGTATVYSNIQKEPSVKVEKNIRVFVDPETECEYFYDPRLKFSVMSRRYDANGNQICGR